MSSCRTPLLAALALVVGFAHRASTGGPADAGTTLRIDLEQAVERAELVVEGRVGPCVVREATSASRGPRIETRSTLAVSRSIYGDAGAALELRLPGGVLPDGRGLVVPGLPSLKEGDEVVLMLSRPGTTGVRLPIGLAQGVLRVERAADGTPRALVRDTSRQTLADEHGNVHEGTRERLDYAATITRLESAANARKAREASGGRR